MTSNSVLKLYIQSILFFAIVAGSRGYAQLNANNLQQYSELDGLPSAEVHRIIADRFGYIWIGTSNGLTRFDGYQFKRFYFNPNDTATIHGLDVSALFEDHKRQIWVGAAPSFLNVYSPATSRFKQYDFVNLIKHPADVEIEVSAICEDNNKRIYFGIGTFRGEPISSALLYKEENEDTLKKFIIPDSLPVQNVNSMTKDKWGNIWLLCYNGLFEIDTNGKLTNGDYLPIRELLIRNKEYPQDIVFDQENNLWVTSNKGHLYCIHLTSNSAEEFTIPQKDSSDYFGKITLDKYENIWIGTSRGLVSFNRQKREFSIFKNASEKKLEKSAINELLFDSFGTLWIGTFTQGLLKYEEKSIFRSYSYSKGDENSLTSGWANVLYESEDGQIWVTTAGASSTGGINQLNLQTNSIYKFPYSTLLPSGYHPAQGIFENSPGELLFNTANGNWQLSPKTKSVKKVELQGVPDSLIINQYFKDSKGNFWLCTQKGLYEKNKSAEFFSKFDLSHFPGSNSVSNEITKAIESPKHGLWLATNNGLYLYNYNTEKIERHGFDKNLGDIFLTQDINSFYEDKDGTLWVGTWQGGLSRYNVETKKIITYTQNEGLPSMSVQGILPDEKNNTLWLSTFEGLSRMDLTTKQFNNFSVADGIQSLLFADGSYLKTRKGLFVFGGSNGVTIFNPDDINKRSTPPIVLLTDLKLFDKSVMPGEKSILKNPIYDTKEITLDYNQNNISLEFIALHYSNPTKNRYAYKLENYDDEWRDIGIQHTAFYASLPPGKYVFRVKAANNNGVWNEQGVTLDITVNPPWWKTTWAYLIDGLLLFLLAFGLDRYLRQRLIRKEQAKNQVRELAQAKEIEKAYQELKITQAQLIQSEKMASLGALTAGIAHEIQNPLNFVNNFSEVNKELAEELKQEIERGNYTAASALADDIKGNEEKINHHGKRADGIVKGMLQHSQTSKGIKEPVNINVLAEEYLRLAYNGLKAKDKNFSAKISTEYDETIANLNIIPQDISRVLLNLYNNAFYAVSEKKKQLGEGYEPMVAVSTKKKAGKVEIDVSDNGIGIPQKIVDKIFQPFFTTKPTGQGTGLGLSLSYDIIKSHGGEIIVATKEGEGTEFRILMPID